MKKSFLIGLSLFFLFSTAVFAQGKRRPDRKGQQPGQMQNRGGQMQNRGQMKRGQLPGNGAGEMRQAKSRAMDVPENEQPIGAAGIAWYTTWETGLAEAKRSNRPIFFMSAATVCSGVSGVF